MLFCAQLAFFEITEPASYLLWDTACMMDLIMMFWDHLEKVEFSRPGGQTALLVTPSRGRI